jgi:hypothetical protein
MLLAALLVVGGVAILLLHASMSAQLNALPGKGCADPTGFGPVDFAGCEAAYDSWSGLWRHLLLAGQLALVIFPVLLGAFSGASLFGREIEQGTHVFAFTQSVGRVRWMTVKLAMVLVPSLLVVVVLQLLGNSLVAEAGVQMPQTFGPFTYLNTESTGLLPARYLLLGCAAGALVGSVWGRALPATIATLIGLTVVRLAAGFGLPWLLPTQVRTFRYVLPLEPNVGPDMLVRWGYLGAGGRQIPGNAPELFGCTSSSGKTSVDCFAQHGVVGQFAEVVPASYRPVLQAVEFAVFAVVAGLLLWATARTLRRRE